MFFNMRRQSYLFARLSMQFPLLETQLALIDCLPTTVEMSATNYLMKYPDEMDISSLTDRVRGIRMRSEWSYASILLGFDGLSKSSI